MLAGGRRDGHQVVGARAPGVAEPDGARPVGLEVDVAPLVDEAGVAHRAPARRGVDPLDDPAAQHVVAVGPGDAV